MNPIQITTGIMISPITDLNTQGGTAAPVVADVMLYEDGNTMLYEDGNTMIYE